MVKLRLNFKERHLCFVANILKSVMADSAYDTLTELIREVNAGDFNQYDLITINMDGDVIIKLYDILGEKPERYTAQVNEELEELLKNQLTQMITAGGEDAVEAERVLTAIGNKKHENLLLVEEFIEEGRKWIKSKKIQ